MTMSDFHKFGLVTMVGWNVMLIVLIQINSAIKQLPLTYIFNDGTGGIGISIFFLIWSIIWYGIGYKSRKDYVLRRKMFKENFSLLDDEKFNKAFHLHYVSEQAKIFSIVFLTAIPWYILGYTNESISKENIIIIMSMGTLSLICFLIFKKLK